MPGPGFYLTLISLPLLFFSALTVCCGWRQQKRKDAYPASYEPDNSGSRFGGFGSKISSKFGRKNDRANSGFRSKNVSEQSNGTEKIPMQSSRQRVLDAFRSEDGAKV